MQQSLHTRRFAKRSGAKSRAARCSLISGISRLISGVRSFRESLETARPAHRAGLFPCRSMLLPIFGWIVLDQQKTGVVLAKLLKRLLGAWGFEPQTLTVSA